MAVQQIKASTANQFDAPKARATLLQIIHALEKDGPGFMQAGSVLRRVAKELKTEDVDSQQAILTIWHDLFRSGVLAPGYNIDNPDLPHIHLTDKGRKTLSDLSRDPSNPDGYMAVLKQYKLHDAIAISYAEEAVNAYVNGCAKSAVVMIGCASERIVLMVRDELCAGLTRQTRNVSNQLQDWRFKTVRDSITTELDGKKSVMSQKLRDSYASFWLPCTEQMRQHRNDAGHPQSIAPVTDETVHANLLLFPTFANLALELIDWIKANY